jgi:hypothetical protein
MNQQIAEWSSWGTPQKCKKLDGKGRKLMFYDRTPA